MDGGLQSALVLLVFSGSMLVDGENCSLTVFQFTRAFTVTASAVSVSGSTPGVKVTWNTTIPPECVTSVTVNFRTTTNRVLVAQNTTTNTQTEIIQTGLQCGASYYIRVVVTGEPRRQRIPEQHVLYSSQVRVFVGAIPVPFGVRAEVTADNTSIRVSWQWSCQDALELIRVDYQPEGGSLMMYTVDNTTATNATLPNLQCNTKYTIWVHASGGQIIRTSAARMVSLPARVPPTPADITIRFTSASSIRVAWKWTGSGPGPNCFNTTCVAYRPERGGDSSLQLSDPAATEATLTGLQCNTNYTITVVATAGEHRRESVAMTVYLPLQVPSQCAPTSAVAGVAVTAVVVLLVVAGVQSVVIWHQRKSIARIKSQTQRTTTEIPLKECSAYGQIYRGAEREEPHIYERTQ